MNIYTKKKRWKFVLFGLSVGIVGISLWYTNFIVRKFAEDERNDVRIWADAIQRKAKLVKYTEVFFEQIKEEEQKRAETFAGAYKVIGDESFEGDLTFYIDIIRKNTTIPVIITNEDGMITSSVNYEFEDDTVKHFNDMMRAEFSVYPPIPIRWVANHKVNLLYLYYKESVLFSELRHVLDDLIQSFLSEVEVNSASVPVIVTDSLQQNIITFGNIDSVRVSDSAFVADMLDEMRFENTPIELDLPEQGKAYIFYKDSYLLTQILYFPYIQFGIIGLFLVIAYFLFSSARRAEQNQVWVGMSKETAHQIGTPLSSIMAWIEILKMKGIEDESLPEIEKDIERLEKITDRFSKIGSQAKLENQDLIKVIRDTVSYFKSRSSKKVIYRISFPENKELIVPINTHLFEWVIENLCKNAVDAMSGSGTITIDINNQNDHVVIDFKDTGKGIPKSMQKTIFNPGYTSKKRGWGLGLTLSQRIVRDYHRGKIFVKSSSVDEGTIFRIVLKKK